MCRLGTSDITNDGRDKSMFSYENGVLLGAFMYLYFISNLLVSINSQFERNLNKVGERISWLSMQIKPMKREDVHPPLWKTIGKFAFISGLHGIFVFLSWVNVALNLMLIAYRISQDRGVPTKIREFRWKLRNQDLSFDDLIRERMLATGVSLEFFEAEKANLIASLCSSGLMANGSNPSQPINGSVDQVYETAVELLNLVLDNPTEPFFSELPVEVREELRSNTLEGVRHTLAKENTVEAVRNAWGNLIILVSNFNVLIAVGEYVMFDGISGELRSRIPELAEKDDDLKAYFEGLEKPPSTPRQMLEEIANCVFVRNLQLQTYDAMRIFLGDYDKDRKKDWLRPFLVSQQIFIEWSYRKKLGMPSNITGDDKDTPFNHERPFETSFYKAIMHSRWPEILEAGHKNPRLVWEKEWEAQFGEPSPFNGRDM
jgi:hypothetical protein